MKKSQKRQGKGKLAPVLSGGVLAALTIGIALALSSGRSKPTATVEQPKTLPAPKEEKKLSLKKLAIVFSVSALVLYGMHLWQHETNSEEAGFSVLDKIFHWKGSPREVVGINSSAYEGIDQELPSEFFMKLENDVKRMRSKGQRIRVLVNDYDFSPYLTKNGEIYHSANHAESLATLQRIEDEEHVRVISGNSRRILMPKSEHWGTPSIRLTAGVMFAGKSGQDYPLRFKDGHGNIYSSLAEAAVDAYFGKPVRASHQMRREVLDEMELAEGVKAEDGLYLSKLDLEDARAHTIIIEAHKKADGYLFTEDEEAQLDGKIVVIGPMTPWAHQNNDENRRPQKDFQDNTDETYDRGVFTHIAAIKSILRPKNRFPATYALPLDLAICATFLILSDVLNVKVGRKKRPFLPNFLSLIGLGIIGIWTIWKATQGYLFDAFFALVAGVAAEALIVHKFEHFFFPKEKEAK